LGWLHFKEVILVGVLFSFLNFLISIATKKRQNMNKMKIALLERNGLKHVPTQ